MLSWIVPITDGLGDSEKRGGLGAIRNGASELVLNLELPDSSVMNKKIQVDGISMNERKLATCKIKQNICGVTDIKNEHMIKHYKLYTNTWLGIL